MKVYIVRNGQADFVVDAATIGDAIIRFWQVTRAIPEPSYRIHHGRRRQGRQVSAAVAYWLLSIEMRSRLRDVIEEIATTPQYQEFCENVIQAGALLEK